jgi:hypothetical protein
MYGGETALFRAQGILSEEGGQEQADIRGVPIAAALPGSIDYDDIYRHVEMRLGENIACARVGFNG